MTRYRLLGLSLEKGEANLSLRILGFESLSLRLGKGVVLEVSVVVLIDQLEDLEDLLFRQVQVLNPLFSSPKLLE